MENKLLSRDWIYDNIFEFTKEEKGTIFDGVIDDLKQQFRFEQIAMEGNDPAITGEKDMVSTEAGADTFTFNENDWKELYSLSKETFVDESEELKKNSSRCWFNR